MAKDVIMPVLGMNQDYGVVVRWLVDEGGAVKEGEPLLEVETDKAIVEVPALDSGVLANVSADEGAEVPTGTVIAVLLGEGEVPAEAPAPTGTSESPAPVASSEPARPAAPAPSAPGPSATTSPYGDFGGAGTRRRSSTAAVASPRRPAGPSQPGERPLASPKARRLSRELGLDIRTIAGSGPGGAVRAVDLMALLSGGRQVAANGAPTPATTWLKRGVDLTALRATIEKANAFLGRNGPAVAVTSSDLLARLTLAAFGAAGLGRPQRLGVTRGTRSGSTESYVLEGEALASLLGSVLARERGTEAEPPNDADVQVLDMEVQVLDMSEMPFESSLPTMPGACRLRVALASTAGGNGGAGSLTLEHRNEEAHAADLMVRLCELIEDPVGALMYV